MRYCPDCGKKLLKEDLKYCPECGSQLKAKPAPRPAVSEAPAQPAERAERPQPQKPKGPFSKYWAWTISGVIIICWFLILWAVAGYHDDTLRSDRAAAETAMSLQVSESKPMLDAQVKTLAATAASEYASAIQTDAMAIQQNLNKLSQLNQLSDAEKEVVANDFANVLRDTVYHCEFGRVFLNRERAVLEAGGSNVTMMLGGLAEVEAGVKETAAGVLASAEESATPAEKVQMAYFLDTLRSIS